MEARGQQQYVSVQLQKRERSFTKVVEHNNLTLDLRHRQAFIGSPNQWPGGARRGRQEVEQGNKEQGWVSSKNCPRPG
ncbi:hypothetical protein GDO78_003068 [Eleutherodactylus coqui]|uniref:Uncharacterized protein n=1 Tax=Eleutherodactylus coqui TaxID=57060 RepID=A0A8J6EWR5_ELECQ|nr:hypothetical protein GDO78_003068 [Eleutherodactylus coqui]